MVPFGQFLKPCPRPYTLKYDEDANLVGMHLYGEGPFHRELKPASRIAKKSHFVIKSGDVLYNKLFAWKGAFGIVPPALDGMFVSDKFPTYMLNTSVVHPRFLSWYFRYSPLWEQARSMSTGSASLSKLTLNPPKFLQLKIPLMPLPEQVKLLERIDSFAEKVEEARGLRQASIEEASVLRERAVNVMFDNRNWPRMLLRETLAEPMRNGLSLAKGSIGSGVRFAKVGCVNSGRFDPAETKLVDIDLPENSPYWLRPGDVLFSRGNTPDLVGRAAVYEGMPARCAFSDLLIRARVKTGIAEPHFLASFLHSTEARDYVKSRICGTSSTMPKISQPKLEAISVPLPTLSEQRTRIKHLELIQKEIDDLSQIQLESAKQVETLLPIVLDLAFHGSL
jgi:type I restriction enzyme S subunit